MVLGKFFSPLWPNLYAFGQIFMAVNGQILKTQSGHMVTLVVDNSSMAYLTLLLMIPIREEGDKKF